MNELGTATLPVLPLSQGVVLPHMVVTLTLESPEALAASDAAASAQGRLLLVPRVDGRYARVGTVAAVEQAGLLPDGHQALLVRGLQRATIGAGVPGEGSALWVQVTPVAEDAAPSPRAEELAREYRAVMHAVLELRGAARFAELLGGLSDPGAVADSAGYWPDLDFASKVRLLETLDVEARLELALSWAREALADLQLRERVRTQATEGMERSQREYLLRQQLAAIRKELGEDDGDVAAEYRRKLADADMPPAAREAAEREVDRLERMSEQSPEHSWVRTWLDWITELPWGRRSEDRIDLAAARAVLDDDHTGLDDVKQRVLEYLAVRKLRQERGVEAASGRGAGAILALVGPPGVGKTSLGESVARALGRRFVRVALGGVRDEAEIRGHRRTYVGAQPGRIVRALREAATMNPVFVLDEVDKVASDWRGDPAAALLEVLDPAQNHTFRDHYLEVDLDLSEVLFIATANVVETIPPALLDRLEVIRLDGYTDDEKVTIARAHLLPRQVELAGLQPGELAVTDAALSAVVSGYTREAGVRGLERQLGKLARKAATRVAGGEAAAPVTVDAGALRALLGRPPEVREAAERTAVPGVATGLAVTGAGGDVLFVEATVMDGEPGLTLTGQLGGVMKESAEIALSYVRSHAAELGLSPGALERRRVHLHVPAGAVPKDGPSAGVTMTAALASLLTGRPVRSSVGMTGEVTLQGRVLPVGGIKQKVLAAHRSDLREVILPARNADDLEDVPEAVRAELTFHLADDVRDVLAAALPADAEAEAAAA
ncbi:MAG TPA: endopeptidase La [Egibacteraceae bacterium]|nr:endopeptidase La [Egibacteraceae bacterium]